MSMGTQKKTCERCWSPFWGFFDDEICWDCRRGHTQPQYIPPKQRQAEIIKPTIRLKDSEVQLVIGEWKLSNVEENSCKEESSTKE